MLFQVILGLVTSGHVISYKDRLGYARTSYVRLCKVISGQVRLGQVRTGYLWFGQVRP